jgi:hypothetical protein
MYRNATIDFEGPEILWSIEHAASPGIDLHITLAPVSSKEPLQLGSRWRGKGGRRE